jgi:hypothetical protein
MSARVTDEQNGWKNICDACQPTRGSAIDFKFGNFVRSTFSPAAVIEEH